MIDEKSKKDKIHSSWRDMKSRCKNPKQKGWKNYGGRGILVCERWNVFKNFYEDMEKNWFPDASIDRIDNNGNYEPKNCQWLSRAENSRKSDKERVENKTHHFLDGEIARKSAKKRVENKTHHLLSGEIQRKSAKERVENKTHHLLGGEIQRQTQKERVENKTHNFLDGEISRQTQKKRVENKTHPFLGKGMMSAFDLWVWKNVRIHKDVYYANPERYLSLNSKEYKNLMGGKK